MLVLEKQGVLLDLKAAGKKAVIKELAAAVHCQCPEIEVTALTAVLMEREQVGSTGVGNGVAIPHGKILGLDRTILCFGRSRQGVSYDAVDKRPVQLFVLIVSPEGSTDGYLKTLATVSRLLKDPQNRNVLLTTSDRDMVVELFARQ